ncbi:hypothetical protein CROQUDRAFT_172307 [Cronartium quercuum f. sp. fusiforme G11]|uniref:Uncharacterized protein n=1 Tax=Cronartium quercuum f. sp. fusiforme G11 TaxID=708437 RepID=A0A9P6NCY7_9BASI|nr:hypothetical protein CROQUDRAFT_172307 [Cronartium quercuum f. sp. fusiforme G11]
MLHSSGINTSTPSIQTFYFSEQNVSTLSKRLSMLKSISALHISNLPEKKSIVFNLSRIEHIIQLKLHYVKKYRLLSHISSYTCSPLP